jgi:hypothetical protein
MRMEVGMTWFEQDRSFFEELEAAVKRLSIASETNKSTADLRVLFDELKGDINENAKDVACAKGEHAVQVIHVVAPTQIRRSA